MESNPPYEWSGTWEGRLQITYDYDTKTDVCGHLQDLQPRPSGARKSWPHDSIPCSCPLIPVLLTHAIRLLSGLTLFFAARPSGKDAPLIEIHGRHSGRAPERPLAAGRRPPDGRWLPGNQRRFRHPEYLFCTTSTIMLDDRQAAHIGGDARVGRSQSRSLIVTDAR